MGPGGGGDFFSRGCLRPVGGRLRYADSLSVLRRDTRAASRYTSARPVEPGGQGLSPRVRGHLSGEVLKAEKEQGFYCSEETISLLT